MKGAVAVQETLGPVGYEPGGYRVGSAFSGESPGTSGMATLATLSVSANQTGESRLILSAPIIVRLNGTEQAVMQTVEGIYVVGLPTATPTASPTTTPTPTITSTPSLTETPEPNGDLNGDQSINSLDLLELIRQFKSDGGMPSNGFGSADLDNSGMLDSKDFFLFDTHWKANTLKR